MGSLQVNAIHPQAHRYMFGILLSPRLETGVKIHQLEHEFDIPMENDMGEELNQMCNLSDYVEEIGIKKGIEQGIEQGIERGREEGIEQGREQLLTQQVLKKLSRGKSVSEIAGELEADEDTIYRILEKIDQ